MTGKAKSINKYVVTKRIKRRAMNDQEKGVQALLDAWGIRYDVRFMGTHPKGFKSEWPEEHDAWYIAFTRDAQTAKQNTLSVPFHTGTGLRSNKDTPVSPYAGAVLAALVADCCSVLGKTFLEWCDEYCLSDDSIKALNTYNECCTRHKQMVEFFGAERLGRLEEVLEGY